MASSSDFKKLYEKYQDEGVKHGISIVQYCQMNGVVYGSSEISSAYKMLIAMLILSLHHET